MLFCRKNKMRNVPTKISDIEKISIPKVAEETWEQFQLAKKTSKDRKWIEKKIDQVILCVINEVDERNRMRLKSIHSPIVKKEIKKINAEIKTRHFTNFIVSNIPESVKDGVRTINGNTYSNILEYILNRCENEAKISSVIMDLIEHYYCTDIISATSKVMKNIWKLKECGAFLDKEKGVLRING